MAKGLEVWLQQQLGQAVQSRRPQGGGCIHNAWCVTLADGRCVFVKTNRAAQLPLLVAEAEGLRALASVAPDGLQVPSPLALGCSGDTAVLVLPWLALSAPETTDAWHHLGRSLARLHRGSLEAGPGQGRFGWSQDNFIGATPQRNGWELSWTTFFVERRLAPQLALAEAGGLGLQGGERLLAWAAERLAQHSCEAVLVHGDLWSGNAGLLQGGGAALFDPAVHRADREVDLAMARLFGGFPDAVFAAYEAEWPLPAGAAARVALYNVYHLLNHANLFGAGYRNQAQRCINGLLQEG